MRIVSKNDELQLTVDADEAFELLQALESHKRKLGRLANKPSQDQQTVKQAYNSTEKMIAELCNDTGLTRKSQPYLMK